jgi:Family of unknown function (DUF6624)
MAEPSLELIARMQRDQQVRSIVDASPIDDETWAPIETLDLENTAWLKAVVDRGGWPRRSEVGEQAALAAWLLVQHADHDLEFQRRCLGLLTEAVACGEADPDHLAYLTDRVRCAGGNPQLYGTQFWRGPDGSGPLVPQRIEDLACCWSAALRRL